MDNTRILYNPENGAVIKNVMYHDEVLFSEKNDEAFEPGMVVQVTPDVFDFLLGDPNPDEVRRGLFAFLEEMTPDEAKKYLATSSERLKCAQPGCEFGTRIQSRLDMHMREHKKQALTSTLGIPLVGAAKRDIRNLNDNDRVKAREQGWDAQDRASALTEGPGLQQDRPRPDVIMS